MTQALVTLTNFGYPV